jgi:hypothetical protein
MNQIRIISLIFSGLLLSGTAVAQNVLSNGGFEQGENHWFRIDGDPHVSVALDSQIVNEGTHSARISVSNSSDYVVGGWFQSVSVQPDTDYLIAYAVKNHDVDLYCFPFLNYMKQDELIFEHSLYPSAGTQDWTVYRSRIHTPPDTDTLTLFLFIYGKHGDVWFDSISLFPETDGVPLDFHVHCATRSGDTYRSLGSSNGGLVNPWVQANTLPAFRAMDIPAVRTHDYHDSCDIHVIFPDPSADPQDPASYNFVETDIVVQSILGAGSDVYFRLGESYELEPVHNRPPADFRAFAQVCLHIVQHYNAGWNNGFHYQIRDWEVWNEPDINAFWDGTALQYSQMYEQVARTLKDWEPRLRVGGPTVANLASREFIETFLGYIQAHQVPLDFFSYHFYNMVNPWYYTDQEALVQDLLNAHGLNGVATSLSEWNINAYNPTLPDAAFFRDNPWNASYTASALIYLQSTTLGQALRYRTDEFLFPLILDDGSLSWPGVVFREFAEMGKTPFLVDCDGGDRLGTAVLAGMDRESDTVNTLISYNAVGHNNYTVTFDQLDEATNYHYVLTRISKNHKGEVVGKGNLSAEDSSLHIPFEGPVVDRIELSRIEAYQPAHRYGLSGLGDGDENRVIHLVNPHNLENHSTVSAYTVSGELLETVQLILPPHAGDCGHSFFSGTGADSIEVTSDQSLLVFEDHDGAERASAHWACKKASISLLVPHVAKDTSQFSTEIFVLKRGAAAEAVEIVPFPGLDMAQTIDFGPGYSSKRLQVDQLWPDLMNVDWISLNSRKRNLSAHEIFQSNILSMEAGLELHNHASKRLVFAHIASDVTNFWTGLVAINLSNHPEPIRISFYSQSGLLLRVEHSEPLQPGGKKVLLYDAAHLSAFPEHTAWLEMKSEAPMTGYILLGSPLDSGSQTLAGYVAVSSPVQVLNFPHFKASETHWSGFVVLNLGIQPESLTFRLYSESGTLLDQHTSTPLLPSEKRIFLGSDLFPGKTGSWVQAEGQSNSWAGILLWGDHGQNTRKTLAALACEETQ